MTPNAILSTLLEMKEDQARFFLQSEVPLLSPDALERLVGYLKHEVDRRWVTDPNLSFTLSGYLVLIGNIAHNKYYTAIGLMACGDALRRLDRDQEALPFFDAAGEEFLALKDEVGWARTRIGRISACLRLNRPTEALRDAARARDIFVRHGKLRRAGEIDVNAAMINFELGNYDLALRLFDRAIEAYRRHGSGVALKIARALGNKAFTLAAQGKFREAVALHEQARATFTEYGEGEEISVARSDLNIASIYAAQGHYSRALLLYNQSQALFKKNEMRSDAHEVAQYMCDCLLRLNRAEEAYELAGETVPFFRLAPGQRHNLARSLMFQADAATLQGNFLEAGQMLAEASALLEEVGLVRLVALVRLQRAHLYFADGLFADSSREVQYVVSAFAEQEDLPYLARALLLQARIADAQHNEPMARDLCNQALDMAENQGLLELKYLCFDLLGRLAERSGDLDGAALYYERAIQGIDEVQSRLVLDERTSFLEDKGSIYQRATTLALRRNQTDQAWMYVEKAKSQVLGDYLRNNIDIRLRASDEAGEAILEKISDLREEQAWFSSIVYHTEDGASLTNLGNTTALRLRAISPQDARQKMQSLERDIERLLEKMQLRSAGDLVERPRTQWFPNIVAGKGGEEGLLLPYMPPQAVTLEYYVADQDLYIFSLSRKGINVQVVRGVVSMLERLLSLWRTNLDLAGQAARAPDQVYAFQPLQENGLGLLKRIYDLLLRPVSDILLEGTHLTIIPYGMLHVLPFHCLFDGAQFVVERFSVSYLPSAALADICYQRGQRIRERGVALEQSLVLGLSDGGRLRYAVQEAETVAHQLLQRSQSGSWKSSAPMLSLPSTAHTREAKKSSDVALGTVCVLDGAATSAVLWQRAPTSPIIHIAAHGLFRLDAPNFSYIKLADRQLSTIEVFNLDLSACSLLVLSACETGRSVVGGIDEVIGLGRGFLYAGAASLLPTLWKVDDASSAELMQVFYQALLQGCTKAVALANAQRVFLTQARASTRPHRVHPYFWAAFHLIGDVGALFA